MLLALLTSLGLLLVLLVLKNSILLMELNVLPALKSILTVSSVTMQVNVLNVFSAFMLIPPPISVFKSQHVLLLTVNVAQM